ncbi:MAG: hypothetical protein KJ927_03470, partial [Candidatus Eisenbacteria bacterium]|nr:hypothetical protein [Candidatus Eisenbacteria bacterium]
MNEFKRRLWLIPVLAVCLLPQAVTLGDMSAAELGYCEETTVLPDDEEVCPGTTLLQNDDGSFENGYAWRQEQVQPPDYGAWAECYEA